MKRQEAVLDFGTIRRDDDILSNIRTKEIIMTVFSKSEWILLAKPNSSDSFFDRLFTDSPPPISYSVKTERNHRNRFYPFIYDDYIIIASGKKTSKKGKKLEIELRLNAISNLESGDHTASIDFVLLTKDIYEQKMKRENKHYFYQKELVKV